MTIQATQNQLLEAITTGHAEMIKFLLKIFCVFLVISCTKKEPPSDEELKKIFFNNKKKFIEIKEICYKNKNFRVIEIEDKKILDQNGKKIISTENEKIFQTIAEKKISPIFKNIHCLQYFENGKTDILSVMFVYYSAGISVSGRLKSIDYKSDVEKIKFPVGEYILKKIEGEENWFIFDSEGNQK